MICLGSHRAHSAFVICLEVAFESIAVEMLLGNHGLEPHPWDFLFTGKVRMLLMG